MPTTKDYDGLSQMCVDLGWNADIVLEQYAENYGMGKKAILETLMFANSDLERASRADQDEFMRLLKIVHEQKAEKPKQLSDFFGEDWVAHEVEGKTKAKAKKQSRKKTKKAEIPEWIKEAREDLFSTNREGHVEIGWELLEAKIRSTYIFKTMNETREVYYYHNGIYIPAHTTIEAWLKTVLGTYADWRLVRKVEDWIRYSTYTKRSEFDSDKNYIPLLNGLMNIKTGALENFDSEKKFTSEVPVEYDPEAGYEPLEQFMHEVLHSEDIPVMQEIFGYTLYAGYPSAKMFWFNAPGSNGKTTVVSLLKAMLGEENVAGVGLHEMDGTHRFALAGLYGCRLNDMAEAETKQVIQTPTLKRATGGDLLHAEKKGIQERFKFYNYAKFVVSANEVPRINDNSLAMRRRLLVVEFPNTFAGLDDNPHYAEEFIAKNGLAGMFNWALAGLKRLISNNWQFTGSKWQDKAKADMMRQARPVTAFLDEWTEFNNRSAMDKNTLYEAFEHYCDEKKIIVLDENRFIREVKQQNGIKLVRNQAIKGRPMQWRGIRFKPYIEDSIARKRVEEAFNIESSTSNQSTEDIEDLEESLKI